MEKAILKKYFYYIGYLFCIALVGLMIIEIILGRNEAREWEKKDAEIRPYYQWCFTNVHGERIGLLRGRLKLMYHPYLVYSNLPNQQDPHFQINSLGARGPEIGAKIPGKRRIVLLGGSAAFGTGLDNDSQTLAQQLEIVLPNTEVINAAVIGYQSRQELTAYVNKWGDMNPDVVIEFGGFNDFAFVQGTDLPPDFGGMNAAWQIQAELGNLHNLAYAKLPVRLSNVYRAFFPHVTKRIDAILPRLKKTTSSQQEHRVRFNQIDTSALYANNIAKMARIVRADEGHFMCILQPVRFPEREEAYAAFRKEVKINLGATGVDFIDSQDVMSGLNSSMFMDDMHLDPEGNRIVAMAVADAIRKRGL